MVNNTNDMKEYMRLYYQKKKEDNPEKLREYERIKKNEYRARRRGMTELMYIEPNIFHIKSFRNNH